MQQLQSMFAEYVGQLSDFQHAFFYCSFTDSVMFSAEGHEGTLGMSFSGERQPHCAQTSHKNAYYSLLSSAIVLIVNFLLGCSL